MMKSFQSAVFLQGSGFEFPNEVWLSWRQSALFEADLAIFSRHVAFEKTGFSNETGRKMFYPGICLI